MSLGGGFVLPEYIAFLPLRDNQLFWFANHVWRGTAVTDPGESSEGQMTLASSVPGALVATLGGEEAYVARAPAS